MSQFAIFVTVKVKPGMGDQFKEFILENATAAVRDEPECHEFRVLNTEGDAETFHFFEVYTNAAALDVHRETPHYKKFAEGTADMVLEKEIQPLTVLQ